MERRNLILFLAILAVVAAGVFAWSEYERKPKGADELKADMAITAMDLLAAYVADEAAAEARFSGKVLEVYGTVERTELQRDKLNVFLSTGDALQHIACEFEAASAPSLEAGAEVHIRGICAGYNLDVLLQRCTLVP